MRISDWSSDVCSSDLTLPTYRRCQRTSGLRPARFSTAFASLSMARTPTYGIGVCNIIFQVRVIALHATLRRSKSVGTASGRSEEHTSELQSLIRNSYAVFCLKKQIPQK